MSKKIGLVAGEGALPRLVSENAQKEGYEVYAIAINWKAYLDLQGCYTQARCQSPAQLAKLVDFGKEHNLEEIIIIGKLHKLDAIAHIPKFDSLAFSYLKQMINFEDNTFHNMLEKVLSETGFKLLPQSRFLQNNFVQAGHFSNRKLTDREKDDLEYGKELAEKASLLEVSQTIVVKERSVMAFEAAEGTDPTIKRGCKLAKKNAVIVKIPWKKQSEYFDLPTVGPRTIQNIAKNRGSVLAIKAGQTFVIDFEETLKTANKYNISFLAF